MYKKINKNASDYPNEFINKIIDQFLKSKNLNDKLLFINNLLNKDEISDLLNQNYKDLSFSNSFQVWEGLIRNNQFDVFNEFSYLVDKNNTNFQKFLCFINKPTLKYDKNFIDKENIAEIILNNVFFGINTDNLSFALDNLVDSKKLLEKLIQNPKQYQNYFKQNNNFKMAVDLSSINQICKNYEEKYNNSDLIIKYVDILYQDSYFITEHFNQHDISKFTNTFKYQFLLNFFKQKNTSLTLRGAFNIFTEIIDKNEFEDQKDIIFTFINKNCDLLSYAIIKEYYTVSQLASYLKDPKLKASSEQYILEKNIEKTNFHKKNIL